MTTPDRSVSQREPQGAHPARLAFAVFGGTAPWTVHLIASYAIASYACGDGGALIALHLLTVVAGGVAVAAILTSLQLLRSSQRSPHGEPVPEADRDAFLASGGVLLGALGLMAIVLGEVGVVVVGCGP